MTVCFHVDDLLITSASTNGMKSLEDCLSKMFSALTFARGENHSYISLSINQSDEKFWEVNVKTYIDKCLEGQYFPSGVINSSGNDNLFCVADEEDNVTLLSDVGEGIFQKDIVPC